MLGGTDSSSRVAAVVLSLPTDNVRTPGAALTAAVAATLVSPAALVPTAWAAVREAVVPAGVGLALVAPTLVGVIPALTAAHVVGVVPGVYVWEAEPALVFVVVAPAVFSLTAGAAFFFCCRRFGGGTVVGSVFGGGFTRCRGAVLCP